MESKKSRAGRLSSLGAPALSLAGQVFARGIRAHAATGRLRLTELLFNSAKEERQDHVRRDDS